MVVENSRVDSENHLSLEGAFYTSLTEVEVESLHSQYGFADGHAYHSMPAGLQSAILDLPQIWEYAQSRSVPEMEKEFRSLTAKLIRSPTLAAHPHYSISPTASNSIDIVGAWLDKEDHKVGLLEPVFDNLYLLLKRRKVRIESIGERDLVELDQLKQKIIRYGLTSLFIVTPNNPTGFQLNGAQFHDLCSLCASMKVALIVDKTFRLYSTDIFDNYKILEESGIDYAVIEDTGKTWPTQDLKASLMAYSESLSKDMRMLYEEVFLCSSSFALALLGRIIDKTHAIGIDKIVWSEVAKRTTHLERALAGTQLFITRNEGSCAMPVIWLDCGGTGLTDLELIHELKHFGVVLLPGRLFFRNSQVQHTRHVRFSLLKPDAVFYEGVEVLKFALKKIGGKKRLVATGARLSRIMLQPKRPIKSPFLSTRFDSNL